MSLNMKGRFHNFRYFQHQKRPLNATMMIEKGGEYSFVEIKQFNMYIHT